MDRAQDRRGAECGQQRGRAVGRYWVARQNAIAFIESRVRDGKVESGVREMADERDVIYSYVRVYNVYRKRICVHPRCLRGSAHSVSRVVVQPAS